MGPKKASEETHLESPGKQEASGSPYGVRSHPSSEGNAKEFQETMKSPDKFRLLAIASSMSLGASCASPLAPGWGALPTDKDLNDFMWQLSGTLQDPAPEGLPPSPAHVCRSLFSSFS